MENAFFQEIKKYRLLNKVANVGGTVLVGSSFLADIPVNEFKQAYSVQADIYNRSISGLTIGAAKETVSMVMEELKPNRILVQLGETDLEQGFCTIPEMIENYRVLISTIRTMDKRCKIVLVSVCENEYHIQPEKFNSELYALSKEMKCQYADITNCVGCEYPAMKAFRSLRYFMTGSFSLSDAMDTLSFPENPTPSIRVTKVEPSMI